MDHSFEPLDHYRLYCGNSISLFVIFHLWVDACWLVLGVSLSLDLFALQISFLLGFHFQLLIRPSVDPLRLEADSTEFTLSLIFILPIKF